MVGPWDPFLKDQKETPGSCPGCERLEGAGASASNPFRAVGRLLQGHREAGAHLPALLRLLLAEWDENTGGGGWGERAGWVIRWEGWVGG